jgi:hypothetical protein
MRDIYDDEQRSYRSQILAAQRVAAAPGGGLRRGSLPMSRIACVAAPRPRSAALATRPAGLLPRAASPPGRG